MSSAHDAPIVPFRGSVALVDWTHVYEDYLQQLGLTIDTFRSELAGGWLFGYMNALRLAGIRTVFFCMSAQVARPWRFVHEPTGHPVCVLPVPTVYRAVRRRVLNPYASTVEAAVGNVRGPSRLLSAMLLNLAPYLATPLMALVRELRRQRCDVVLCQEYEHARFDVCVMAGRLLRLPVFATFQGGDATRNGVERCVRPWSVRHCTGLIIPARCEAERVEHCYGVPSVKIARIFNPVDLAEWRPDERAQARSLLGLPQEAQIVAWHGRVLWRRKGLDVLLAAWDRLCRECPGRDLRLVLIGTGQDAQRLRAYLAAHRPPGVLWIDQFLRDRVLIRRYLSAADIYVLSSRHEGFPVALIEAMACGLPVIAADAPGVPDILEGGEASGGLIVPRDNAEALAESIGRVLDDEIWRRELGRRARQRVERHFSLETVGEQLRAFLFLNRGGTDGTGLHSVKPDASQKAPHAGGPDHRPGVFRQRRRGVPVVRAQDLRRLR